MSIVDALIEQARAAGKDHGRAAGSWVFDGNTPEKYILRTLQGIEDGDPAITLPSAPLSGEWADDPTIASVFENLEMSGDEDYADEVLDAYEDGFYVGVEEEVVRSGRAFLGLADEDPIPVNLDDTDGPVARDF